VKQWEELRRGALLHEDDNVLILNKPPDISVMGERHGTDLVRMAAAEGEDLHPAHRIDKVTSGVIVLAKSIEAHGHLTRQFAKRTVDKRYLAIVVGQPVALAGTIDLPLLTASSGRIRVAAERSSIAFDPEDQTWKVPPAALLPKRNFDSITRFRVAAEPGEGEDESSAADNADQKPSDLTLLHLHPVSGRRHQLRVHLAWIGHPILGDPLFKSTSRAKDTQRTHLHALSISIRLPGDEHPRRFRADPNAEFLSPVGISPEALEEPDYARP